MSTSKKPCEEPGCSHKAWKAGRCHKHQISGAEIVSAQPVQPAKPPTLNASDPGWKVARYLAARFSLTGERVLASELVLLLGGLLDGRSTDS